MSVEEGYREVRGVAERAAHFGHEIDAGGAEHFGALPHIGPLAWLYIFFPPLAQQEMDYPGVEVGLPLPSAYRELLSLSNGFNLFLTSFCVHGLRTSYDRSIDASSEPFDVVQLNVYERPPGLADSAVVVGGWDWDGSHAFVDLDGAAGRCSRDDGVVLNTWGSLGELLASEVKRLEPQFDAEGRQIDETRAMCPLPVAA